MITNEEAERRGRMYDGEGLTYLFDLDYFDSALEEYSIDRHYTIDAKHFGNESHLYVLTAVLLWFPDVLISNHLT